MYRFNTITCLTIHVFRAFLLLLWLVIPIAGWTAPAPQQKVVTQEEQISPKGQIQTLEVAQTLQQKDIEALHMRLNEQSGRIGDIQLAAGLLGSLITISLAALGIVGYITVTRRTRQEAEEAAKNWFSENAKKLLGEIEEIRSQAHTDINDMVNNVRQKKDRAIEEIQVEINKPVIGVHDAPSISPLPTKNADIASLQQLAKEILNQPESSYSFDDWNTLAFSAYSAGVLDDAISFWDKAAKESGVSATDFAQVMFNKGVALWQQNRSEDAIKAYDRVINLYTEDADLALHELIAQAMFNKGVTLGQLNRNEEAIDAYNSVITLYSESTEQALRKQAAQAMFNKGVALRQLNRSEEAILIYDQMIALHVENTELIARAMCYKGRALENLNRYEEAIAVYDRVIAVYDKDAVPALRELAVLAMNCKGFSLLCQAKSSWSNDADKFNNLLLQARQLLESAQKKQPQSGMIQGNLAYVVWLMDDTELAERLFRSALVAQENGGKWLYKKMLAAFEKFPIEPDAGVKELLERLWIEYQVSMPT
jgi:tetratricopeptide (TPR) repeat protein